MIIFSRLSPLHSPRPAAACRNQAPIHPRFGQNIPIIMALLWQAIDIFFTPADNATVRRNEG